MAKENLDELNTTIASLTEVVGQLLKALTAGNAESTKEALLAEIEKKLEDVPESKLPSVLDYVNFLSLEVGGDENTGEGQE